MAPKPEASCEHLKKLVREVPDFPKPGILFYDITTLLKDKLGFATLIDALSEHYLDRDVDLVLGIEARGFIFGPALACRFANRASCRRKR
jgi:adenine phosphoribosyltransferase